MNEPAQKMAEHQLNRLPVGIHAEAWMRKKTNISHVTHKYTLPNFNLTCEMLQSASPFFQGKVLFQAICTGLRLSL